MVDKQRNFGTVNHWRTSEPLAPKTGSVIVYRNMRHIPYKRILQSPSPPVAAQIAAHEARSGHRADKALRKFSWQTEDE